MKYKYQDLPSDDLKADARQWWIECEKADPAWINEHKASLAAALEAHSNGLTPEVIDKFREGEVTGYCDDYILSDLYDSGKEVTRESIRKEFKKVWNREMRDRTTNIEQIEENIMANEYEFKLRAEIA